MTVASDRPVGATQAPILCSPDTGFPFTSCFYFTLTTLCDCVYVRPLVEFTFLEQSFVDEIIEIRIEPTVIDILLVIVVELLLDCEPVWFLKSGGYVQDVSLEPSQIVHLSVSCF